MWLAIDVVVLTIKNRDLKAQRRDITGFEPAEPLEPGTKAESISVTLLDGRSDTIRYDQGKYLLFIFSTTCPHCEATIPIWKSIMERLPGERYPIAISVHDLDRTNKFVAERGFPFYTVIVNDSSFRSNYKINGVPVTILIDETGRVQQVWKGRLEAGHAEEILSVVNQNTTASF